jgi:hypothetical protein
MKPEEVLETMNELRRRLNREIERCNYDLNAPSVMKLSALLDEYIALYYCVYKQQRSLTGARV